MKSLEELSKVLGQKKLSQSNANTFKYIPQDKIQNFVRRSLNLLYPNGVRHEYRNTSEISTDLVDIKLLLEDLLKSLPANENNESLAKAFIASFPNLYELILLDMKAAFEGDPAAATLEEVAHCYPGPYAIAIYRLAHELFKLNIPILPRILTELGHQKTGIDIHPGANIGESFFIDHGTGVVIGETSVIGKNVKLYQGVTLGALSVEKSMAKKKRHPTIEDNCVIYAHATILGGETIVGRESVIGGNVWLTRSIPAHSLVYHRSEIKHDYKQGFKEAQELTYEI